MTPAEQILKVAEELESIAWGKDVHSNRLAAALRVVAEASWSGELQERVAAALRGDNE